MTPTTGDLRHARLLWDYLRLGIPVRPADCLLVFGGHDIGVADRAAELYRRGTASLIVVSGGSRAVPDGSENFWLSAELLRDLGLVLESFLAVTKPYAERRTTATARRRWPHKNFAATSQEIGFDKYLAGDIPADRILSHLAGEALRLDAYAAT